LTVSSDFCGVGDGEGCWAEAVVKKAASAIITNEPFSKNTGLMSSAV
jgi:hypothetical protein